MINQRRLLLALSIPVGISMTLSLMSPLALALAPESMTYYQQAVAYERAGDLEKAEQVLRQATAADPSDYLNFVKLASVLNSLGKTKEAISFYHQAAKLNAQDPMIFYSLGALYEQTGEYANAEKAYKSALARNPQYQFGQLNLARVLIQQANYTEAQGQYDKFLALYPEHYEARKNLANLLLVSRQPAEAAKQYEYLKTRFPDRFNEHVSLAKALTRSDAPEKALSELQEAYAKDGNKNDILEETGHAHAALGQYDFAIQSFGKALETEPSRVDLWLTLGELYLQKKDAPGALNAYRNYLSVKPENTTVRQMVANLYLETKQYDAALTEYSALLADDTLGTEERYQTLKQKGFALQMNGETEEAITLYRDLLGTAPQSLTDWQLKLNLALAFHKTNQLEEAVALYRQVYYSGMLDSLEYGATARPEGSHEVTTEALSDGAKQKAVLSSDLTSALTALGDKYYQAKEYKKALPAFAEATQFAAKNNYAPWLGLANTYYALDMDTQAYEQYRKVLAINPNEVSARLYSAKLELAEQNHTASLPALQQLAQQHPENTEIQLALAEAYTQLGDHPQAVTVYENALRGLKPEDTQTAERLYLGLADRWQALNDNTRALNAFEEAAKRNPDNATTYYNLGVLYNETGNLAKSAESYQRAIVLNPNFYDAHYGLAVTYEKQNKPQDALGSYEKYATDPTRQYFQQALGRIETLKQALNINMNTPVQNAAESENN